MAIPWFGYGAYLLPLRRRSAELAFVLANHSWLARTGPTYEAFPGGSTRSLRRAGRWLVTLPAAAAAIGAARRDVEPGVD